ncbi:MAG: DUF1727 domain-containing protein [Candidatus Levybacteria bacterium]|nr:DUF1727 domain-containing protein [Candidatus Levybacteria bacterium]
MGNIFIIYLGKLLVYSSRLLNLGQGSTWPGHLALNLNKNFIKDIVNQNPNLKIILIAGTNGKTTTGKLIQTILEKNGEKVFQNEAGANLTNGIASSLLLHSNILSTIHYNYAIFEVDEATLPLVLNEISPDYLILLNLFRDQLDRYGEVNMVAEKWRRSLEKLTKKTRLILNADDPQIAFLGLSQGGASIPPLRWIAKRWKDNTFFFGLDNKKLITSSSQHASDSTYCPNCSSKLHYDSIYFSHLGDWKCNNCGLKRPKLDISEYSYYPLSGIYNRYNTLAAVLLAKRLGIQQKRINSALHEFKPAFGRQEILRVKNKNIQIFLSKNPTSFNESLRTISDLKAQNLLFVLNDRIPDGTDTSWIWDVDFEDFVYQFKYIIISGDRALDLGLRLKYCGKPIIHDSQLIIQEDLKNSILFGLNKTLKSETLYILPTYSAMLEVRKILTGKKIL